jgi:hypothetical protein
VTLAPITFALLGFLLAAVSSLVAGGLAADKCTAQDIRWRSLLGAPT